MLNEPPKLATRSPARRCSTRWSAPSRMAQPIRGTGTRDNRRRHRLLRRRQRQGHGRKERASLPELPKRSTRAIGRASSGLTRTLADTDLVTIAAVNGPAVGAGLRSGARLRPQSGLDRPPASPTRSSISASSPATAEPGSCPPARLATGRRAFLHRADRRRRRSGPRLASCSR